MSFTVPRSDHDDPSYVNGLALSIKNKTNLHVTRSLCAAGVTCINIPRYKQFNLVPDLFVLGPGYLIPTLGQWLLWYNTWLSWVSGKGPRCGGGWPITYYCWPRSQTSMCCLANSAMTLNSNVVGKTAQSDLGPGFLLHLVCYSTQSAHRQLGLL